MRMKKVGECIRKDGKTMFECRTIERGVQPAMVAVGIKRLLDDLRVTAAQLTLLVYKLLLLVQSYAASTKLQLLKD
ncbi:hypothetical protein Tco_1105292 [Tanacetum coccineum]